MNESQQPQTDPKEVKEQCATNTADSISPTATARDVKPVASPAPQPFHSAAGATPRDRSNWEKDFAHENGNYLNLCCECGRQFRGHKRRVACKLCCDHKAELTSERAAREAAEKFLNAKTLEYNYPVRSNQEQFRELELKDEEIRNHISSKNGWFCKYNEAQSECDQLRRQLAEMKEKACVLESQVENADVNLEQVKMNECSRYERQLAEMTASRDALGRHPDISECPKGHKFRTISSHPAKSEREWECPHCSVAERDAALARVEELEKRVHELCVAGQAQ